LLTASEFARATQTSSWLSWNKIHPSPERSKRKTLKKKRRKGKQKNTSEEAFIPKSKPNPLNYTLNFIEMCVTRTSWI
jgi:hypothetical protein